MEPYIVVDARGGSVYIGPSRAAARWHLDRDKTSRVASGPDNFFDPSLFERFISFIIGLISRLFSRRSK